MNERRKIAITGIGLVTPVGNDRATTWKNLKDGVNGIDQIQNFDASGFSTRIGAEVKDFDFQAAVPDRKLRKFAARSHRFAFVAAEEALNDAGIRPEPRTADRWAFCVGAGMMGFELAQVEDIHRFCCQDGDFDPDGLLDPDYPVDPIAFFRSQTNAPVGLLTQHFGVRGYSTSIHSACASGGQAIGTALRVLRRGTSDFALVGGYDSMLNPLGISGFCLLGALSLDNEHPERASRPFDLKRNGFVLGEGAGFLVLEDWRAAEKRGAHIYAELAGDGNSLSCYRVTDSPPDGNGPIQSMQHAIADAGITPGDIGYINAHGTSTPMNDPSECAAIRAVLGEELEHAWVSSTKSCMGHLIAAAGAVEAAVCALAIEDGIAPVSANLETPDPECNVKIVRGESKPLRIRGAISNSFGFGGSNNCLVLKSPE